MNIPSRSTAVLLATAATLVLGLTGSSSATAVPAPDGPITLGSTYTGNGGYPIGVDSKRGLVYMLNDGEGADGLTVYHETTGTATNVPLTTPDDAYGLAVDPVTGYAFLPGGTTNGMVTVVKAGQVVGTVDTGDSEADDVTLDPVRHIAYVQGSNDVYAIKGTTLVATIAVGTDPYGAEVNPDTGVLYVPNYSDGTVSVIKNGVVKHTITVGGYPYQAAVDPLSGLAYVTTDDGFVHVLEGAHGREVTTLAVGGGDDGIVADPVNHLVYAANSSDDTVTVIKGTKVLATLDVPTSYDQPLAVDPVTGVVLSVSSDTVTAMRGTHVIGSVPIASGDAELAAFDVRTGKAFISTDTTMQVLRTPALSRIKVRRPIGHHAYRQGSTKRVRYSCHAGRNNTITACTGTRRAGGLLPTGRLGRHTFRVRMNPAYGPVVVRKIHYRVVK